MIHHLCHRRRLTHRTHHPRSPPPPRSPPLSESDPITDGARDGSMTSPEDTIIAITSPRRLRSDAAARGRASRLSALAAQSHRGWSCEFALHAIEATWCCGLLLFDPRVIVVLFCLGGHGVHFGHAHPWSAPPAVVVRGPAALEPPARAGRVRRPARRGTVPDDVPGHGRLPPGPRLPRAVVAGGGGRSDRRRCSPPSGCGRWCTTSTSPDGGSRTARCRRAPTWSAAPGGPGGQRRPADDGPCRPRRDGGRATGQTPAALARESSTAGEGEPRGGRRRMPEGGGGGPAGCSVNGSRGQGLGWMTATGPPAACRTAWLTEPRSMPVKPPCRVSRRRRSRRLPMRRRAPDRPGPRPRGR